MAGRTRSATRSKTSFVTNTPHSVCWRQCFVAEDWSSNIYVEPITPAIHGPKYFKPNPDLGAHTNFQAPYDDAGNSGQFQFYSMSGSIVAFSYSRNEGASKFPESLSNQPGTTTDYPVRDSPYSSLLTPDGKIHTHSIPGGIHATGPIPDPLPPYYVDEDMTSNNPYASSNPNAVPPAAASLAGPHHSSHSRSRQYAGVDKQARHKSKSSKSHGHR